VELLTWARCAATDATDHPRSVVGQSHPGKGFDRGKGTGSLRRHERPARTGIGIEDGTTAGSRAKGAVTHAGDARHRGYPGGVGDLPGEHGCGLVRKDGDAGITSAAGVLADDPTSRRRSSDQAPVGAPERRVGLGQRRAGRSARGRGCGGRYGCGGRARGLCRSR